MANAESLSAKDRLIVALDLPTPSAAEKLVAELGDSVGFYKVGLQLFTAGGTAVVEKLVSSGKKVFLDLKFHDIPNTVAGAVQSAARLGATFLTVHAAGGPKMLAAAVDAANASPAKPKVLAVTMLTSVADSDLPALGLGGQVSDHVLRWAAVARDAGCHGIVCSPLEAAAVRKVVGAEMLIVTPGIRGTNDQANDQARTLGPSEALQAGASHLVVGRPITAASDPAQAAESILAQMSQR